MSDSRTSVRFPGETESYRHARNELLEAETELRRNIEAVAAKRRGLPLGGKPPEDYVFEEIGDGSIARAIRLSELFADGKDTLVIYSYMYGPKMAQPCPNCTSILDALDGEAPHITQHTNLAVVAKSPISRITEFARARGWRNLRLLSSAGCHYNRDYHAEKPDGGQDSALNVFVRRDGATHHFYSSELQFAARVPGQDPRHVDLIWPLWHVLDLTPEGRGQQWHPRLSY
jgi:predicted dithiol-disulfide oxidoreductase (DUF899 family)